MGGRGSGSGIKKSKATPESNAKVKGSISSAVSNSNNNINVAAPKIREILNEAPLGTELKYDAYRSSNGQMQNSYKKVSSDTWSHSWGVKNGETYWSTNQGVNKTSTDIFNDITQ